MRKVFFLLLALSAVAGAPIAGTAAETRKVAGQAIAVAGPVVVLRPDVVPRPLTFRDNLYWRDVVEARKDGIARVLLGGRAAVTVRELSRLELREERRTEGVRYVVDLVSGKIRASVARMLMRPGDQVEVWTFNTVASVRGTDFIVETLERPTQAGTFGLLGVRQVADAVGDGAAARETVVVTLSGLVDVVNPLAGTGRTEQVGAYEAVRVSGRQDPVRLQVSADEMKVYLRRLTPPRPQQARSGDKAASVGDAVEQAALAASERNGRAFEQRGDDGGSRGRGGDGQGGGQPGGQGSESGGRSGDHGHGSSSGSGSGSGSSSGPGNGLALGQGSNSGSGAGIGNGLAIGNANLTNNVGKGKGKK